MSDPSVDARAIACERLVEDAIERDLSAAALADSLKGLGLKVVEAIDYLDDFKQRIEIRHARAKKQASPPHESSPSTGTGLQGQEDRDRAVEEAAWATLRAKLDSIPASRAAASDLSPNALDKMLELFGQEVSSSSSLLKSVLAVAPHLADVEDSVYEDPHLNETQKCKIAYTNQKPFENLIIKAQGRKIRKPIANSIWRLVILDKYVDFEKFFITLEPGYNPNDEAKELNDRFTLLEKNSILSRRAIVSEAEWMCLYDAWVDAVLLFYPHRKVELSSYREVIINMFRATSSPLPAIKYDRDSRERYARQPCRLDSSKDTLPFPLLSQLLSSSHVTSAPSSSSGKKRSMVTFEGPRKRSDTICQNWNLGSCEGDTCHFGRRHNECSECNGPHRAKDKGECFSALNRQRQHQRAATTKGGRA
ncbi:hypothetical protein BYT27DRAFT_7085071 [Phlegmacium glaucopus]|nr:hypothetical protein BYT27DRAFT_7085071 [Phlegmacium glaucopus]